MIDAMAPVPGLVYMYMHELVAKRYYGKWLVETNPWRWSRVKLVTQRIALRSCFVGCVHVVGVRERRRRAPLLVLNTAEGLVETNNMGRFEDFFQGLQAPQLPLPVRQVPPIHAVAAPDTCHIIMDFKTKWQAECLPPSLIQLPTPACVPVSCLSAPQPPPVPPLCTVDSATLSSQ